jgi:hypothetical protein
MAGDEEERDGADRATRAIAIYETTCVEMVGFFGRPFAIDGAGWNAPCPST